MFDDNSDRSDDETTVSSFMPSQLKSGHYTITTVHGAPLGCERKQEVNTSLVVTLPRTSPAPKWHIQRHESGHYTVNFDDLPIYFEQMALLVARERDQGYEWIIEPGTGKNGVYKFRNASVGAYIGFEDVWIAPNMKESDEGGRTFQVRIGDVEEATDDAVYFRVSPA